MCVGEPMQVIESTGHWAICEGAGRRERVDLALVGEQRPGAWLLVFLGAARETLEPERAFAIRDALDGLRRLMAGGDLGEAFADLEAEGPRLPPHLEAARKAGLSRA
ncbi:MAG: HypC/HybG/HupF family hydrogenase formation chaperone [Rubricella sp.]